MKKANLRNQKKTAGDRISCDGTIAVSLRTGWKRIIYSRNSTLRAGWNCTPSLVNPWSYQALEHLDTAEGGPRRRSLASNERSQAEYIEHDYAGTTNVFIIGYTQPPDDSSNGH